MKGRPLSAETERAETPAEDVQPARADIIGDQEMGQQRDAMAIQRGATDSLGVVGAESAAHRDRHCSFGRSEPPDIVPSPAMIDDAVVLLQISGLLWYQRGPSYSSVPRRGTRGRAPIRREISAESLTCPTQS